MGATRTSWSGHTRNTDRETQGPKGSFPRAGMMLVGRLGMVQTCSCVEIGGRSEGRISSAHYDFLTWLVVAYRPQSRNCRRSTNRSVVRQRMDVPRPNAGFWRWHAGMLSSESRTLTRARSGAGMVLDRSTAGFISHFMRGGTEFCGCGLGNGQIRGVAARVLASAPLKYLSWFETNITARNSTRLPNGRNLRCLPCFGAQRVVTVHTTVHTEPTAMWRCQR